MDFARTSMSIALVAAALAAFPAQAGYKGVFKTPAMPTQLAAQRPLNSIVATSSRLVAVGPRGHIIYSDDKGGSWKQADVPVSSDLTAVFFSSERSGWAVGHDGVVLHSDDAGQTWKLQLDGNLAAEIMRHHYDRRAKMGDAQAKALLPEIERYFSGEADKPFLDVWFANDREGYVVGAFNMIFRTVDGGKSWEPWFERVDNPRRLHLYSVRGDGKRVFIAGEQGLFAVLDAAGERFEAVQSPYSGSFFGVLPIDGGAVVLGMRGNAFRVDGKGGGWQKLETGVAGGLTGAAALGGDRLALVSTAGDVIVGNANAGRFGKLAVPRTMSFAGIAFLPSSKSLALVGNNGAAVASIEQK